MRAAAVTSQAMRALAELHPRLRTLVEPRRNLLVGHRVKLVDDLVFALLNDPAEQLGDIHQCRALVAELEFDLADLARLRATAFEVVG